MKTKILLLLTFLILAVSCSKNNSLNPAGTEISNYEGTYTGRGKYTPGTGSASEEDFTLVVSKDSTVIFKTQDREYHFNSFAKTDDKSYSSMKMESGSFLIFSLVFDGNGNVNVSLIIQETSEKYTADKLTKTSS